MYEVGKSYNGKKTEWLESEYLNNEKEQRDIGREKGDKDKFIKERKNRVTVIFFDFIPP